MTKPCATIVLCPFYKKCCPTYIVCEGLNKNGYISINFRSKIKRAEYMKKRCCAEWSECILAKALDSKYE